MRKTLAISQYYGRRVEPVGDFLHRLNNNKNPFHITHDTQRGAEAIMDQVSRPVIPPSATRPSIFQLRIPQLAVNKAQTTNERTPCLWTLPNHMTSHQNYEIHMSDRDQALEDGHRHLVFNT